VSDQNAPNHTGDHALVVPSFGKSPALSMDMSRIREAERRLIEAKMVNPITYADLEHTFAESYRDLKKYLASIGYQITQAEKSMEEAKAVILLDRYPEFLKQKEMKKSQDNADLRKAFMIQDADYVAALDRFNQLKALEAMMDGKIKVIENVCRYMRQQMRLVERSGMSNANYYNTQK
jgi:hypothetical protein